jgi:hypothetical protein
MRHLERLIVIGLLLSLADARAAALKAWLLGHGVPGEQLFAAGDGPVAPDGAVASVVQMQ